MKNILLFMGCIVLAISCSRCKEDCTDATNPDCPNYNHCLNEKKVSAEFKMFAGGGLDFQLNPTSNEILDNDTAWCKSTIVFQLVNENVDSVKWLVGNDPTVRTETSFDLLFGLPYFNVNVKCIVYGKQSEACFGTAYTSDTVVKRINVVHWPDLPIWTYKFRCHYNTDPTNEFDISFTTEVDPDSPEILPFGDRYLLGLPHIGNCTFTGVDSFNHAYLELISAGPVGCTQEIPFIPNGYLNVSTDKRTIFGYINIPNAVTCSGYRIN